MLVWLWAAMIPMLFLSNYDLQRKIQIIRRYNEKISFKALRRFVYGLENIVKAEVLHPLAEKEEPFK